MAIVRKKVTEKDRGGTSLRIVWRDVVAEANGIPAVGIVVVALIVVFAFILVWVGGPPHSAW